MRMHRYSLAVSSLSWMIQENCERTSVPIINLLESKPIRLSVELLFFGTFFLNKSALLQYLKL